MFGPRETERRYWHLPLSGKLSTEKNAVFTRGHNEAILMMGKIK